MSCGLLPTPSNSVFFGLENMEGVKEGCEGEVQSEILAGGDWTRCGSPPMTPGEFYTDNLHLHSLLLTDRVQHNLNQKKVSLWPANIVCCNYSVHPPALGNR